MYFSELSLESGEKGSETLQKEKQPSNALEPTKIAPGGRSIQFEFVYCTRSFYSSTSLYAPCGLCGAKAPCVVYTLRMGCASVLRTKLSKEMTSGVEKMR